MYLTYYTFSLTYKSVNTRNKYTNIKKKKRIKAVVNNKGIFHNSNHSNKLFEMIFGPCDVISFKNDLQNLKYTT